MRLLAVVLLLAVFAGPTSAVMAELTSSVTIADHIGIEWKDELVHYPINSIPVGAVKGPATASVQATSGPVLVTQVSDVLRHADGSIQSMTVWFQATVPANGRVTYIITPGGKSAPPPANAAMVKHAPDRERVSNDGGFIELTANAPPPIALRLPDGGCEYVVPGQLVEKNGPIQRIALPSGATIGPGRWEAPFRLKSYRSKVTASGPLFAEAEVHYVFDVGYWTFTARVTRGSPMIVIREEFDTGHSHQEWDKADRFYSLVINGGAFKPAEAFFIGRNDRPEQATLLNAVSPEDATKKFNISVNWFMAPVNGYAPTFAADRDDFYLTGYPSVQPRIGGVARFVRPAGDALGIAGLETGWWRNPLSLRARSTKKGELLLSLPLQMYKQGWAADGFGAGSPNYTGLTLGVPTTTSRRVWGLMLSPAEDEKAALLGSLLAEARKQGSYPLDKIKDWTLDWPDPKAGETWAEKASPAGIKALTLLRNRVGFAQRFGAFGRFSMAYHFGFAKHDYPDIAKVIDSPADLTVADRKELRRLAAWNAYDMHQVDTFPWGTGFHLNNPNMSIMAVEARAKSSVLIKDHPLFKRWGSATVDLLRLTLERFSRQSGATYENPHYTLGVTFAWGMETNQILIDNGIGDACNTELFKKNVRFFLNWLTPPDPRFLNHRMCIPIGNCSYQSVPLALAKSVVEYYKSRDPQLAGEAQWWANQTLPEKQRLAIVKEVVPKLGSARFEDYGVFFRHGFGTPYETLLHFFAGNCDGHAEWESDQMTYTLYAKGQPINLHFGNGYFPMFCRPWTRNRVSIDHKYEVSERNDTNVAAASFNPETEYARAYRTVDQIRPLLTEYALESPSHQWAPEESKNWPAVPTNIETIPPVTWFRQIMFLKDADPKGPNYFVIRDSFGGTPTRPTDLSFWFLASKMDRAGNTFHFDGQCKVDMDLFVHTPQTFGPQTGKHGHTQQPYGRDASLFDPRFHPDGKRGETQLFLRMQQPAGKGYLVVLYPRLKEGEPAATFSRLADGVVRVETPLSSDYVLIDSHPIEFQDDKVEFQGLAASVRFFKSGKIAVANSDGRAKIKVGGKTITGDGPFVATIDGGKVRTTTHSAEAKP